MLFRYLFSWSLFVLATLITPAFAEDSAESGQWQPLFDGETLNGWTPAQENQESCRVEDGKIVLNGERCHLFYTGGVGNHDFKNFKLKLKVMTKPGSNSGVYIHTKYQEKGWPNTGYEIQVNNSQSDWRRTGSVYAVQDVTEAPAKDNEWFDYLITVDGKKITVEVDGKLINDFTETEDMPHLEENPGRKLSSGTIALQAHDPGSTVYYKDIEIKLLP